MKPVLVGEANPYGGRSALALWPDPPGSAGHRLCFKILGMTKMEYLRTFDRVNLCPRAWSIQAARITAAYLKGTRAPLILCGAKVCQAFGVDFAPFRTYLARRTTEDAAAMLPGTLVAIIPHPFGLSRLWNLPPDGRDPRVMLDPYQRARAAVQDLLGWSTTTVPPAGNL